MTCVHLVCALIFHCQSSGTESVSPSSCWRFVSGGPPLPPRQRQLLHAPSPPPPPSPAPPTPQRPQQRRVDARLPPPRPDGDCLTIKRGTDHRLRINVNKRLHVFGGPSSADVDLDSQTQDQTRKRKGREWVEVEYTGTLGTRPQDFVSRLAIYCAKLDIHQELQCIVSTNTSYTTSSLLSLATAHARYTHDSNMARFWQSIIKIQIALRCERFVEYLYWPFMC